MDGTTNTLDSVRLGFTVTVGLPTGKLRFWTGDYPITLEQLEYLGGSGVFEIDTNQGQTPRLKLHLGTKAFLEAFRRPVGPARILVQGIGSLDYGATWSALDFSFRGRLSAPKIKGRTYEVNIVTDRILPTLRTWSDEDHQKIYPGDTIFSQQRQLSDGKIEDDFGDVPLFDPDYYEELATTGGTSGSSGTGSTVTVVGTARPKIRSSLAPTPLEPLLKGGL